MTRHAEEEGKHFLHLLLRQVLPRIQRAENGEEGGNDLGVQRGRRLRHHDVEKVQQTGRGQAVDDHGQVLEEESAVPPQLGDGGQPVGVDEALKLGGVGAEQHQEQARLAADLRVRVVRHAREEVNGDDVRREGVVVEVFDLSFTPSVTATIRA